MCYRLQHFCFFESETCQINPTRKILMSSSAISPSYTAPSLPSSLDTVSIGYNIPGLEKVTKVFDDNRPILRLGFTSTSYLDALVAELHFDCTETGRKGGYFSRGADLPPNTGEFNGTQNQSHEALIRLLQDAIKSEEKSKK
jgi:hypothetical protein